MALIIMPIEMVKRIDKLVLDARAQFPEMNDEEAAEVRQQLVNTFAEWGHIPDFEIVKSTSLPPHREEAT